MSETKANLIFLIALLVLVTPGVTILFIKRLNTPGRLMMPPATRQAAAYMDPTPGVSPVVRFVPPITGAFVTAITRQNMRTPGLTSIVEGVEWQAVSSEKRVLQLVAQDPSPGVNRFAFFMWFDRPVPIEKLYKWTAVTQDGQTSPGTIEGLFTINLDPDLRSELMDAGFIRPPAVIAWTQIKFDSKATPVRLDFEFRSGEHARLDSIDLGQLKPDFKPDVKSDVKPEAEEVSPATQHSN